VITKSIRKQLKRLLCKSRLTKGKDRQVKASTATMVWEEWVIKLSTQTQSKMMEE
jgi:hypothetical protein